MDTRTCLGEVIQESPPKRPKGINNRASYEGALNSLRDPQAAGECNAAVLLDQRVICGRRRALGSGRPNQHNSTFSKPLKDNSGGERARDLRPLIRGGRWGRSSQLVLGFPKSPDSPVNLALVELSKAVVLGPLEEECVSEKKSVIGIVCFWERSRE